MKYKQIKVTYKITADTDGWGRGEPEVISVEGIGCEINEEEKHKAIKQVLYPEGGIEWYIWKVGEIDSSIAKIKI